MAARGAEGSLLPLSSSSLLGSNCWVSHWKVAPFLNEWNDDFFFLFVDLFFFKAIFFPNIILSGYVCSIVTQSQDL